MEEPARLSVLDILEANLKLAKRNTFIHRYAYIAEHHDKSEDCNEICKIFKTVIKNINEGYCDERLTGVLIMYRNYFMHIVESSEETIMKHLIMLIKDAAELLGRAKILLTCHHLNQRLYDVWDYRMTKPPILLEAINPNCDFDESRRYIEICCIKLCRLAIALRISFPNRNEPVKINEITSPLFEYLPENALLNFLLDSEHLRDLRIFVGRYNKIPICRFYTECIWPVRGDFVPYDVFDEERNPVAPLDVE